MSSPLVEDSLAMVLLKSRMGMLSGAQTHVNCCDVMKVSNVFATSLA